MLEGMRKTSPTPQDRAGDEEQKISYIRNNIASGL